MDQIIYVMRSMIKISDAEIEEFLSKTYNKIYKRKEVLSAPSQQPNEVFFIKSGLIGVFITDNNGVEHTIHFALENQFISDYSNFIQHQSSFYTLQALEDTEVIVLPRAAIE